MDSHCKLGRRQFVTGLLMFVGIWLAGLLPLDRVLVLVTDKYNAEILRDTIIQYIGSGLIILIGIKMGMIESMGLRKPSPTGSWWYAWPMVLMALLNIPESFKFRLLSLEIFRTAAPWTRIFFAVSVGFVEEFLGRSLVAAGLMRMWGASRRGLYLAAGVSSLVFGIAHIGNYFVLNYTPLASLTQVMFAMFFGVFFFALFVRTKSVWPGVAMHALVDLLARLDIFSGTAELVPPSMEIFERTPGEFLISMVVTLPLAGIGLMMLRKVRPEDLPVDC